MRTEMDVLVIGEYLLYKDDQPNYEDRENWKEGLDLTNNPRYNVLPQLEEYDNLEQEFALYSMFTHIKNFAGKHITTDCYGFRYSAFEDKLISLETEIHSNEKINILIGGSTAFGVGASSDRLTIASSLSKITNQKWINIGLRASNSFQEYINLLKILQKIKKIGEIVFLSGINDVYMNLSFSNDSSLDDPIFDYSKIKSFMNEYRLRQYSKKKLITASIISIIKNKKIEDLIHLKSLREMIKYKGIIKKTKNKKIEDLFAIFERNFLLYSSLDKSLGNQYHLFFTTTF